MIFFSHSGALPPLCDTQNVIETQGGVLRYLICVFYTPVVEHAPRALYSLMFDSQYPGTSFPVPSINLNLYFLLGFGFHLYATESRK